jgi:ammonium transporter, Amt family
VGRPAGEAPFRPIAPLTVPLATDTGETAWLLAASALALQMAPGLALFDGGLVRSKIVRTR